MNASSLPFPFRALARLRADPAPHTLFRLAVCAIVFTHGAYRYHEGSLPILGEILTQRGFPAGWLLAHLVNLAETAGAVLLALRVSERCICAVLIAIYLTGIVLFHWQEGFFVVGPGRGGWEFSALLIASLGLIGWSEPQR